MERALGLYLPRDAVDDHFDGEGKNHDGKDGPQCSYPSMHENLCAEQCAGKYAEHYGHGHAGVDESAAEIDAGTGGCGHADHEIAGGGGDFEGDAHDAVHGDDFDGAGADTQKAGKRACAKHEAKSRRDIADSVFLRLAVDGIGTAEPQAAGKCVGFNGLVASLFP